MAQAPDVDLKINVDTSVFESLIETAQIYGIFAEVHLAITEARAKHGNQSHIPLGTGPTESILEELHDQIRGSYDLEELPNRDLETLAKRLTDGAFSDGEGTWAHILLEEVAEALAAEKLADLRAELLQVAAMAFCMIRALDTQAREAQA